MKRIAEALRAGDDFLVATHVNPDGDAIGSAVALSMALEALGKKSALFEKDSVPGYLRFLPGSDRFQGSLDDAASKTLVLVDCNSPDRAGLDGVIFKKSIVIDHHEAPSGFGDLRWVDPSSPAVGLMLLDLVKELGVPLTPEMASNLYAAIAVDTGTFRFPNTTSACLRAAAELVQAGARPDLVSDWLYGNWGRGRFDLLCLFLGGIEVSGPVAVGSVTRRMLEDTGAAPQDTENLVNYPLMLRDIQVSVFFREVEDGRWKVSLRSKGDIDVARVAARFSGGGHKNAAGCNMSANLRSAEAMLLEAVRAAMG